MDLLSKVWIVILVCFCVMRKRGFLVQHSVPESGIDPIEAFVMNEEASSSRNMGPQEDCEVDSLPPDVGQAIEIAEQILSSK